jgi:hypothetical protein
MLDYYDAVGWLLRSGGRWTVRATQAACFVVVALDGATVTVPTGSLTLPGVDDAIVNAVERLRTADKHP